MKKIVQLIPGISISISIALIALFLSFFFNISYILIALLIGVLLNKFFSNKRYESGLIFSSEFVLKLGVGLMGFGLSYKNFMSVGFEPIIFIFFLIFVIFIAGIILTSLLKKEIYFGLISGGAVAICGASAAIAITTVLSGSSKLIKNHLAIVILGTTTLSTLSMVLYPFVFGFLIDDNIELGFLLGTSIHDVVGVVGAGYSVNSEVGLYSIFFKMIRVTFLPVFLVLIILFFKKNGKKTISFPWFLILFFLLAAFRNILEIPVEIISNINLISIFLILVSISSIGLKTNIFLIKGLGSKYFLILFLETVLILLISYFFTIIYF